MWSLPFSLTEGKRGDTDFHRVDGRTGIAVRKFEPRHVHQTLRVAFDQIHQLSKLVITGGAANRERILHEALAINRLPGLQEAESYVSSFEVTAKKLEYVN